MARHATPKGQAQASIALEKPSAMALYKSSWVKGVAGRGKCPFSQVQKPSRSGGMGKLVGTGGCDRAIPTACSDRQRESTLPCEPNVWSAGMGLAGRSSFGEMMEMLNFSHDTNLEPLR